MTKRERVLAVLGRKPVDRLPVAFWRHVPEVDHTARGLAEAMLAFQRRWDLDLIKVMSSGVYCVEDWGCRVAYQGSPNGAKTCTQHAVRQLSDWEKLTPLDPGQGALGRELEALRLILKGRSDDVPVLHTVFAPLTIARKLAGERLAADLRDHPEVVMNALDVIADTVIRYAEAVALAGADGIFYASQDASRDVMSEADHAKFGLRYSSRVLASLTGAPLFTMLHVHGRHIYFDRKATLPVAAINWHDRLTEPSLGDALKRFRGAAVGGLSEKETLLKGPPSAVAAEVADAIRQSGGTGVIVAPGCVLPLAVPDESLEAVVQGVKGAQQ
ncbi:MAG TPA: uroporphyrinogen decarboxylase family protein [Terriglobales bacterium]|nr:uroporphyrinogen decarboxylase family protein [Terriglobales bacterium]